MKIYGWVELGDVDGIEEIAVEGGKRWGDLVDGLILSVGPTFRKGGAANENVDLFHRVKKRLPGVPIIPCIKTSPFSDAGGFDDPAVWTNMVTFASHLGPQAGPLVLDHESFLKPLVTITDKPLPRVNWRCLGECVAMFKRKLWWYPGMTGGTAAQKMRYRDIAWWAGTYPNKGTADTSFIDLSIAQKRSDLYNSPGSVDLRNRLRIATTEPVMPMLYVQPGYWKAEELPEGISYIRKAWPDATTTILYPGIANWITTAREIARCQSKRWFERACR